MPVLTLVCCLFAGTASAQSVPVTLRVSDAPLEQVLSAIEKQTTYLFVYDKNVDVARRVSIDVKDTPLNNVLNTLFQSSDIAYAVREYVDRTLAESSGRTARPACHRDGQGRRCFRYAGDRRCGHYQRDYDRYEYRRGRRFLAASSPPSADAVLEINYLGYEPIAQAVGSRTNITFTLRESAVDVDAVVVTALGIKRSERRCRTTCSRSIPRTS